MAVVTRAYEVLAFEVGFAKWDVDISFIL